MWRPEDPGTSSPPIQRTVSLTLILVFMVIGLGQDWANPSIRGFADSSRHAVFGADLYILLALIGLGLLGWLVYLVRLSRARALEEMAVLRRSAEHLHSLFETSPDCIALTDLRGYIIMANRRAVELFGFETTNEMLGMRVLNLVIPEDQVRAGRALRQRMTLERSASSHTNYTALRADGTTFPISVNSSVVRDADGQPTSIMIVALDMSEHRQVEVALRESEERYRELFENANDIVYTHDLDGNFTSVNRVAEHVTGYSRKEIIGMNISQILAPDYLDIAQGMIRDKLASGGATTYELEILNRAGKRITVEVSTRLVHRAGRPVEVQGIARDITERKQAEVTARAAREAILLQARQQAALVELGKRALEHTNIAVVMSDAVRTAATLLEAPYVSIVELLGKDTGVLRAAVGFEHEGIVRFELSEHSPLAHVLHHRSPVVIEDYPAGTQFGFHPELRALGAVSGITVVIRGQALPLGVLTVHTTERRSFSAEDVHFVESICNIVAAAMERKQMEASLEFQALHDGLTDLPNRTLLRDRLEQAILAAKRNDSDLALLFLDLDRFKDVNDSLGHHIGDILLQELARRLHESIRMSDTVARLGGDEFAVLLPTTDEAGAVAVARKIAQAVDEPFIIEDQIFPVGVSIGISLYPYHGSDAATIMRRADVAMYRAKRGQESFCVYHPDFDAANPERLIIMRELRSALEHGQFILHYQPQINLRNGCAEHVEALVRWQHPERGLVPPDLFIPLAEDGGLIRPLTAWALDQAVRQWQAWEAQGLDVRVAVNLSARTLHDPFLVENITRLLTSSAIRPSNLLLEITESAIMVDPDQALTVLAHLHDMGVQIAIDDFGTGYSSLAHLQRLPVDEVKIDRSFVRDMVDNRDNAHIVRSIIDLAHNLGIQVVAEGVEDARTVDRLVLLGCDMAQGYHFSRPLSGDQYHRWLRYRFIEQFSA